MSINALRCGFPANCEALAARAPRENQLHHKAERCVDQARGASQIRSPIRAEGPVFHARQRTYPGLCVQTAASASISPTTITSLVHSSLSSSPQNRRPLGEPYCAAPSCTVRAITISDPAPALPKLTKNAEGSLRPRRWRIPNLHSYW